MTDTKTPSLRRIVVGFKSGQSRTMNVSQIDIGLRGGRIATFSWTAPELPRPLFMDSDQIESIWELPLDVTGDIHLHIGTLIIEQPLKDDPKCPHLHTEPAIGQGFVGERCLDCGTYRITWRR